jgi:hypothetical protein
MRIHQREKKAFQTGIGLAPTCGVPLQGSKPTEGGPIYVLNEGQSVRVAVALIVTVALGEELMTKISSLSQDPAVNMTEMKIQKTPLEKCLDSSLCSGPFREMWLRNSCQHLIGRARNSDLQNNSLKSWQVCNEMKGSHGNEGEESISIVQTVKFLRDAGDPNFFLP